MSRNPTRRLVLASMALLAVPLVWWSSRGFPVTDGRRRAANMASVIAGLFRNRTSAIVLGQAYLRDYPNERDLRVLLAGPVRDSLRLAAAREHADQARIRVLVKRLRRDDFAQGRTVIVNGWLLSLTEARLCGAAALISTAPRVGSISTS